MFCFKVTEFDTSNALQISTSKFFNIMAFEMTSESRPMSVVQSTSIAALRPDSIGRCTKTAQGWSCEDSGECRILAAQMCQQEQVVRFGVRLLPARHSYSRRFWLCLCFTWGMKLQDLRVEQLSCWCDLWIDGAAFMFHAPLVESVRKCKHLRAHK